MNKQTVIIAMVIAAIALFMLRKKAVKLVDKTVGLIMDKLTRQQFIDKFGDIAKRAVKGSGLFPSVALAQAILESGNGNSTLSKLHNNFFGIKADKSWTGKTALMKTTEYIGGKPVTIEAKFRKYELPESSFLDRTLFLKQMKRYKNAGVFVAGNPFHQAEALQRAGYATDPKYAELLGSLIKKYDLQKFD